MRSASLSNNPSRAVPHADVTALREHLRQALVSVAFWERCWVRLINAAISTACCAFIGFATVGNAAELPPNSDRDPALHARLEKAYSAKGPDYVPRTHLMADGKARFVNRLIEEASPYLVQHAHNPVDWRPWSDETLAEAKRLDLPIFLSVGYATCHWCHVMEEESFDNEAIAARVNAGFLPVKVDREQLPEIDHLYITATQLQQGAAGWPNTAFLLPDGRPFHTATYVPREELGALLEELTVAWANPQDRRAIEAIASQLSEAVQQITQMSATQSVPVNEEVAERAADQLLQMHNALEGGFAESQQFPEESFILFLLDHWRRTGAEESMQAATETLYAIAAGGIHDHVGGGFHRYTVDPNWRTPHFEKMLYNQAQLARAFVEAWEITREPIFRRAAERTFEYVARDMTDAGGAFYAAEDADSLAATGEVEEGAFYVFDPGVLAEMLGPRSLPVLGLDASPTLENGAVIHLDPLVSPDFDQLDPLLQKVRAIRETRPRPFRDEKVIAGWNGLMIRALAEASIALNRPDLQARAERAAAEIWDRLWTGASLRRFWAGGQGHEEAVLADYAWLGLAYVAVADASGDVIWEDRAQEIASQIWSQFGDHRGRLKMASRDGPLGPIYANTDGAVPSGESSALELLATLSQRGQDPIWAARAEQLRAGLSAQLAEQPVVRIEALRASRLLDRGPTGPRRTAARGVVRVQFAEGRLDLKIAPGWHLNAHDPGPDWFIGTALDGAKAVWPEGKLMSLGFSEDLVRVYEGDLSLPIQTHGDLVNLTVQACSDTVCLAPETVTFRLL